MGGGNEGASSDEEEEDEGEQGVDSADERSKVRLVGKRQGLAPDLSVLWLAQLLTCSQHEHASRFDNQVHANVY